MEKQNYEKNHYEEDRRAELKFFVQLYLKQSQVVVQVHHGIDSNELIQRKIVLISIYYYREEEAHSQLKYLQSLIQVLAIVHINLCGNIMKEILEFYFYFVVL